MCLCIYLPLSLCQNCFEIFKVGGVIKAWKKDSDGKPVPGDQLTHTTIEQFVAIKITAQRL